MDPDNGLETRLLLGKLIGEVYRLQRAAEVPVPASDSEIYGLLHGFESAIDTELSRIGHITAEQERHAGEVLMKYYDDDEKRRNFRGFYDIEKELEAGGVSRLDALKILRFFRAAGNYAEIIDRMDSEDSPTECRTFGLSEFD